jgi:hypothetical protein
MFLIGLILTMELYMKKVSFYALILSFFAVTAHGSEKKIKFEELDPSLKQYAPLQRIGTYLYPDLWNIVFEYADADENPRMCKTLQSSIKKAPTTSEILVYKKPTAIFFLDNNQLEIQFEENGKIAWNTETEKLVTDSNSTRSISRPTGTSNWQDSHMTMRVTSQDARVIACVNPNPDKKTDRNQAVRTIHVDLKIDQMTLLHKILLWGYRNYKDQTNEQGQGDNTKSSSCIIS